MNITNKIIKLNIWDTAGTEKFKTISSTYYKKTNGLIFVFDLSKK